MMKGYPRWFVPWLIGTLLLSLITGLLLGDNTLALRADVALPLPWHYPAAGHVPAAALHAIGGFLAVMLLGALWSVHMRAGWHRRRKRTSGLMLALLLLLLTATAVAVYYLGNETAANAAAFLHLGAGLVATPVFVWHWASARRSRRRHAARH